MHEPRTLGSVIRRRRRELGWTQEELAERISAEGEYIRQSDISRIERDLIALPRRPRLEHIAAALNLSLGELLSRSGWADADAYFNADHASAPAEPTPVAAEDDSPTDDHMITVALPAALRRTADARQERLAGLGPAFDRFQSLTASLRARTRELSAACGALEQTRAAFNDKR